MVRASLSVGLLALSVFCLPRPAAAGVASDATSLMGHRVDVREAVAVTAHGTTRWSRLAVPAGAGGGRVLWLVPVRPGAAVEWTSDAWLDLLDTATRTEIGAPVGALGCSGIPGSLETVGSWDHAPGGAASRVFPRETTLLDSDAALAAHATARGFTLPGSLRAKAAAIVTRGYRIAALEVEPPAAGGSFVTATVRIKDDGAPLFGFALATGAAPVRASVFAITTAGPTTLARAREIDPSTLVWETTSDYAARRATLLEGQPGTAWVRESSSHPPAFEDASRIAAAAADLAIALDGAPSAQAFVTRFAAHGDGALDADEALGSALVAASARAPRQNAGKQVACPPPPQTSPLAPVPPEGKVMPRPLPETKTTTVGASEEEGCGSSSSSTRDRDAAEAAEGCAAFVAIAADSSGDDDDDSSGGGALVGGGNDEETTGTAGDDDDDEAEDAENPEVPIEWGNGDDDDDDDDDDNGIKPKTVTPKVKPKSAQKAGATAATTMGGTKNRSGSPVSRMALLLGVLALPLRRRLRNAGPTGSARVALPCPPCTSSSPEHPPASEKPSPASTSPAETR